MKTSPYVRGTRWRIDCPYPDGDHDIRLCDTVTVMETPKSRRAGVLVYSSQLRANIVVARKELRPL